MTSDQTRLQDAAGHRTHIWQVRDGKRAEHLHHVQMSAGKVTNAVNYAVGYPELTCSVAEFPSAKVGVGC
jgi:hypothetical protein